MSQQIDELYDAAKAEGGPVVVWAGGDAKSQAAAYTTAFEQRFPEIGIEVTVGLSKYLDAEIDRRLSRGLDVPDVVHLQTLHDFDRWAGEDVLERFRPPGSEAVPERYVDPDGFWSPLFVFAFAPVVDSGQIPLERAPHEYSDFLRPELRDRIILTYPHDDDAVLYQFSQIIAAEGWEWLDRLLEQNPRWVRGTATPQFLIRRGEGAATFTSAWQLAPAEGSSLRLLVPRESFFQAWYQVGGLLRGARHKAAGRLYLAHLLSLEYQNNSYQWPARRDAQVPAGHPPIDAFSNTSPHGFRRFMSDRAQVERLRGIFERIIGPAEGADPNTLDM